MTSQPHVKHKHQRFFATLSTYVVCPLYAVLWVVSDTNDATHGKKQSQSERLATELLKVDDGSRVQHFMFSQAPPPEEGEGE